MAKHKDMRIEGWLREGWKIDLVRSEVWIVNENEELERAPEFQKIMNAVQRLQVLPERRDHIRSSAIEIAAAAFFSDLEDQPNLKPNPGGTAADLAELQDLHDHLFKTAARLYQMHQGARATLERHDKDRLRQFQREVAKWSNLANQAWVELNETSRLPSRKGRPQKIVEAVIRSVALRSYERLTGQPAARKGPEYGPFVNFVRDLFEALGLDAESAASQARQAIEEKTEFLEKTKPK